MTPEEEARLRAAKEAALREAIRSFAAETQASVPGGKTGADVTPAEAHTARPGVVKPGWDVSFTGENLRSLGQTLASNGVTPGKAPEPNAPGD